MRNDIEYTLAEVDDTIELTINHIPQSLINTAGVSGSMIGPGGFNIQLNQGTDHDGPWIDFHAGLLAFYLIPERSVELPQRIMLKRTTDAIAALKQDGDNIMHFANPQERKTYIAYINASLRRFNQEYPRPHW